MPGPGNYQPELSQPSHLKTSPRHGFGTQNRNDSLERLKRDNPGPGEYEYRVFLGLESKKASISPRINDSFEEKEANSKPGPGHYDTQIDFQHR